MCLFLYIIYEWAEVWKILNLWLKENMHSANQLPALKLMPHLTPFCAFHLWLRACWHIIFMITETKSLYLYLSHYFSFFHIILVWPIVDFQMASSVCLQPRMTVRWCTGFVGWMLPELLPHLAMAMVTPPATLLPSPPFLRPPAAHPPDQKDSRTWSRVVFQHCSSKSHIYTRACLCQFS